MADSEKTYCVKCIDGADVVQFSSAEEKALVLVLANRWRYCSCARFYFNIQNFSETMNK